MRQPLRVERIVFPNGNPALCVKAPEDVEVRSIIAALELTAPRALLILNGATAELETQVSEYLEGLSADLARTVIEERITVITGGTNAGIFALFGRALHRAGRLTAPCLGVSAGGCVEVSELEPHHSHFVLVETDEWERATPIMYKLAAMLADDCPSLAVFAGGGTVTLTEMEENVRQNREMIFIAGSQGSTDDVVKAYLGAPAKDERVAHITQDGRVSILKITQPPEDLTAIIRSHLLLK